VYRLDGEMVLYFAGFAKHWSIFPATPAVVRALGEDGRAHLHGRATLRFSYDEPVSTRAIARIAKTRAAETAARRSRARAAAR
jgi:hypothetical protein